MIRSKIQKCEMLSRVADFAARNVSLFPTETAAVELTKDIQTAVEKLAQCKASQVGAIEQLRVSTEQRLAKQEALRNQLEAIHQTAEALKIGGFSLPEKPVISAFFDSARHYSESVGELKPQFIRHGLSSDFIDNLKSAAEDLQRAIDSQVAGRGRRKAAIQEFDKTLEEALTLVQRFEAILSNAMSGNDSVTAAWEVARRIEKPRSSKRAVVAATASSPPKPGDVGSAPTAA